MLPMSLELATVLAAVSVGGGCDSSGRCSTLSLVSSSLEGVRLISGPVDSSTLSGGGIDVSSIATGSSSAISSATGGIDGKFSPSTTGSCATSSAAFSDAWVGSSWVGAGFAAGFGATGLGTGANMLAHVFFADAATAATVDFGSSGSAAAGALDLACPFSVGSVEAGTSHAGDSEVGTEGAPAAARVPFVAPAPRPPRNPPRPRSVPRPRPRTLSPPRLRPAPRVENVPSAGAPASFALDRDRSLPFLTSAN
jgi:hypothetical protein